MTETKIEWCDWTINPAVGCSRGCSYCYAQRMAARGLSGCAKCKGFEPHFHLDRIEWSLSPRQRQRRVFVDSMSDWGDPAIAPRVPEMVARMQAAAPQHTYLVLTKSPVGLVDSGVTFPANWWVGVTAENQAALDARAPKLMQIKCEHRFVSFEPLFWAVDVTDWLCCAACSDWLCCAACADTWGGTRPPADMSVVANCANPRLDWIIIGAQSGPGRKPLNLAWARALLQQAQAAGVPCFVKQLDIDGKLSKDPAEWPEWARVQEYPGVARKEK